jgi:phosphatidylglycerophosphatase A
LGALASEKTCRDLGVQDAGCVVVDEVAAVWLVCLMLPQNAIAWCAAFLAFRLFDIVKLPPASWVDRKIHNGWGIMLDDLLAAVWAAVALVGIDMLCNRLFPGAGLFLGVF